MKKNLLIVLRHRLSSLIIILAPLLLIFMAGIAYDHFNEYRVNIGVYSENYTKLTDALIKKLNTEQFKTLKLSQNECIESIKNNIAHACIIFPKNLMASNQNASEITIYVDYSKLNLAWMIKDVIFTKVEEGSAEISEKLTQDILEELTKINQELESKESMLKTLQKDILSSIDKKAGNYSLSKLNKSMINITNTSILLEKKISSLRESTNNTVKTAKNGLDLARKIIITSKDPNKKDLEKKLDAVETKLQKEQEYIKNMFSMDFQHSIPLLTRDLNQNYENDYIILNKLNSMLEKDAATLEKIISSVDALNKKLQKIKIIKADVISSPIRTNIKPVTSYNTYLNFIFPTLIVIVIMFGSLLLSTIIVMMEKNSGAFFRNSISPTSEITFFFAHYLTSLLIMCSQILIIIITSLWFFKTQLTSNITIITLISLLTSAFFILAGMFIGYLFKSEQTATLAATSTGIFFLLLSNTILPMESMPLFIAKIVSFNPFVISENILRKAIIFNESVVGLELYILISFFIIALIANIILIKKMQIKN